MYHWESLRIFLEVPDRIVAGKDHPTAVDLELDELRIRLLQQHVIADRPAALVKEFEVMVMVCELQACAARAVANSVGKLRGSLGLVEAHPRSECVLGRTGAQHKGTHYCADCVRRAECLGIVKCTARVVCIELQVRARTGEARIIQQAAELFGGQAAEACRLNFYESDLTQTFQRACGIRPHRFVDRIELDSRTLTQWIGPRMARQPIRSERCNTQSRPEQKLPAGFHQAP